MYRLENKIKITKYKNTNSNGHIIKSACSTVSFKTHLYDAMINLYYFTLETVIF